MMKLMDFFHKKKAAPEKCTGTELFMRYREALSACRLIENSATGCKRLLAPRYMRLILRESEEWINANAEELFEPFFVYHYLTEKGLIERKDQPPMLLHPQGETDAGMCEIKIFSSIDSAETGRIEIRRLYGASPEKPLWGLGFVKENEVYVCTVSDREAPLLDRAAEAGVQLIDRSIGVSVINPKLYAKILSRDFGEINRYRVFAPEDEREIAFVYPWNPDLHRRLFRTGAKWNGKYMAMPLAKAENALDVIKLYGFYVEPGAAKRMEMWETAEKLARVMPKSREALKEEEELVRQFLSRPIDVIEELRDE